MNDILDTLQNNDEAALSELFEFLRIPSVSAEPEFAGDVVRCAEWLAQTLARDGFEAKVEPTPGHPVVTAQWNGAGQDAPTILVYGHYDVQPAVREDGWTTEPFEPVVKDDVVYGRGATDDKGQLFCHVAGARAHLRARGELPVNLVFLFEGEEESGSENLEEFLLANRERLACDAVVVSDTAQYAKADKAVPAVTYGLRGLCYIEATVTGPNRDLHSGSFGGAAANPANALARMVGQLVDESGRVNVAGFYDDVRPLEKWERDAWAALGFDEPALARELGVETLSGEAGCSVLERMWARPTLDVNGLHSGWTGEGAKTIIPSSATAKLSCRLVPEQEPETIAALLEKRLRALLSAGLTLDVKLLHGAKPVLLPASGWAVEAAREAVEAGFGVEPIFIREGGSIPVVATFANRFDAPVLLLGFGRPDDRAHGPDERFHLADFRNGMKTSAHLWKTLGAAFRRR